nr:MAG TPA: tail tape measure protein [Caudoviricetes sp.]
MELFELMAKITLDTSDYEKGVKKASESGNSLGSKLKSGLSAAANVGGKALTGLGNIAGKVASAVGTGLVTATKAAGVGLSAAATGVAALSKQALEAYANYEQLVGGVETLFGSSASVVEAYAAQAYQTAGLSANAYMESVTGFSASLLQSLGNDTQAAAEYANTAMVDMSDNANKMGTDMTSIQNAYQGFAKQNYTMLDNLKLGYGGTKEEMERLISDANKVKEANGEMADLSIDSFADIVEAIHIIQTEMGITGTTAKEASTTIQGSVNSMKAAWQNLLVGIADDSQDFDTLMDQFVESVSTAASNILPRIQTILSGIGKLVTDLAPIIAEVLPTLITSVLPDLLNAATSLLTAFVDAVANSLPTIAPQLVSAAITIVTTIADAIASNGPALLQAAMDTMYTVLTDAVGVSQSTADGIMSVLQSFLDACGTIWDGLTAAIDSVVSAVESAGIDWDAVWTGISNVVSQVAEAIALLLEGIGAAVAWLVTEVNTDGTALNAIWEGIKTVFGDAMDTIMSLLTAFVALFNGDWETFGNSIVDACESFLDMLFSAWDAQWQAIFNALDEILGPIVEAASTAWNNMISDASAAWDNIKSNVSSKVSQMSADLSSKWNEIKTNASTAWNNVKTNASTSWDNIKSAISQKGSSIKTDITSTFTTIGSTISTKLSSAYNTVTSIFGNIKSAISDKIGAARDAVQTAIEKIKGFFNFSWSLPKLKLPHISISGKFSLSPPSVPTFGISWYKKAMDNAMILDGATIFGASGGNLLGGGEAGREVVAGESHLVNLIQDAVGGKSPVINNYININGAQYTDERELARVVGEELMKQYRREAATIA